VPERSQKKEPLHFDSAVIPDLKKQGFFKGI